MIFNTLFHKDENENTRIWYLETDGNKYRSVSGIKHGNLVTSEWTITEAKNVGKKNEKSAEEQARLEVLALYKKKLARKYHDTEDTIEDGAKFIMPMLASKYEGWGTKRFGNSTIYAQPKLDGARCLVTKRGMFSREGKQFVSAPHISRELEDFFIDNPKVVLDGELYNHALKDDFNTIMSLIRQQSPTADDLRKSEELIQYHIYDKVSDDLFSERTGFIERIIARINSEKIVRVPTYKVASEAQLDELYGEFMADGYEGEMLRIDAPYEQKRSKSLQKRKEFLDEEFEVSRLMEGVGNWAGYAKVLEFIMPNDFRCENGERPKAGIKGNQEFTKKLLNGEVPTHATVRFQNYSPWGIPRFPIAVNFFWGKRDI